LAATQPTQKNFLANVPSLKSVSTLTPLSSPVVELLIARLGRDDDLDLWRRPPQSPEIEAAATGLIDDPRMVSCDVAHGVDLIVVLPVGKGSDFGEQGF
jgi:hypothetical protein